MLFGRDKLKQVLAETGKDSFTLEVDGITTSFYILSNQVSCDNVYQLQVHILSKYGYSFSSASHILDFVYNLVNWDKLLFKNGKIRQSAINELNKRLINYADWPFTSYMLNTFYSMGVVEDSAYWDVNHTPVGDVCYPINHYNSFRVNRSLFYKPSSLDIGQIYPVTFHVPSQGFWTNDTPMTNGHPTPWFEANYTQCSDCGEWVPNSEIRNGICRACSGVNYDNFVIRGYSERATSVFNFKIGKYNRHLYKSPLLFGIELEYESNDVERGLEEAATILSNHAIFKRDGSLEEGFEIVTAPATLDIHIEEMGKFFENFPCHLKTASTCGMHVHVSREPLNYLTQGKIVEFMNREDNKPFLRSIAGRWSDDYANNDTSRTVTHPWTYKESGRYNVVNTNNRDTLEFRLFASTKKWDEFITRMEFCDAMVAYCSPCQSKAPSLSEITKWDWFAQYVADNRKNFPNLFKSIA